MIFLIKKLVRKIKEFIYPSEQSIEYKKWVLNGGDDENRFLYDLNEDSLVFDLGGYKGQWASDIYARYNCRIFIFEPVKLYADNILKRFIKNPRIITYCFALGASKREEKIAMDDNGTSVYRKSDTYEKIQFENVADFIKNNNIQEIDLMKINIEGGEYEVLPKLISFGFLKNIKNIQIQFHNLDKNSEKLMKEIQFDLMKTHKPTYQYKFIWENWELR